MTLAHPSRGCGDDKSWIKTELNPIPHQSDPSIHRPSQQKTTRDNRVAFCRAHRRRVVSCVLETEFGMSVR